MIDKPGVYKISNEEYHGNPAKQPCLSRGVIGNLIYKSPAFAWFDDPVLNPSYQPEERVEKFDIGNVGHALFLEGIEKAVVIDAPDWRKKDAQEKRDAARFDGKIPLLPDQWQRVQAMVSAAERQLLSCKEMKELGITNIREDGDVELTYVWKENGIWLKARLDWIKKTRDVIFDYKTTGQSANPVDVVRTIISSRLDIQGTFYPRAVKAVEGIEPRMFFMFQETFPPYLCSFVELPDMYVDMGKQKVENGIFLWRECMESNNWFGYPQKVVKVEAARWALNDWEFRNSTIGVDE